jgi:uncharacterized protein (DUF1501 family)
LDISRREFFTVGCSAGIAAMAGGRLGGLFFADPAQAASASVAGNDEVLLVVFLRGGCDGLSLVAPFDDADYADRRGGLKVNGALPIGVNNPNFFAGGVSGSSFGLHPAAAPLKELYDNGNLAIVHACGLDDDTRSHFDAMDYIERGTPGNKSTGSGWLARHLRCVTGDDNSTVPALAAGSSAPSSLLADPQALAMNDARSYNLSGPWRYTRNSDAKFRDAMLNTLDKMYQGSSLLNTTAQRTIKGIKTLRDIGDYATSAPYIQYNGFYDSLKIVAQMIKANLGLRVATVDLGGWDHHEAQGVNETWGPFRNLTDTLSRGLHTFYNDLGALQGKVTVVVMSEFGRRLGVNDSGGTDHGHGNMMLVLGGNVNGGKLFGRWPGLKALDQGQDLEITTDFRSVLGEIVHRRLGNPYLGRVFPGLTSQIYQPLSIVKAASSSLTPDFSSGGSVFVPAVAR